MTATYTFEVYVTETGGGADPVLARVGSRHASRCRPTTGHVHGMAIPVQERPRMAHKITGWRRFPRRARAGHHHDGP